MPTVETDLRHGVRLVWQKSLQRWLTRSSMDQIMPNLFLGGSYAAENIANHNPNNINFVLTCMDKNLPRQTLQQYRQQGIGQLFMNKRDKRDENLLEVFGELTTALEEKLQAGCRVLVHCAMGISRSVTIVCAFVMQRWGLKRSDAKQMVKSKRNVANPNSAFYTQLKVWGNCDYNIRSAISINGVKPFKEAYAVCSPTRTGNDPVTDIHEQANEGRSYG
ncbi:MAG: hypothetical protein Q9176_007877 [Flavoplaca citrina]